VADSWRSGFIGWNGWWLCVVIGKRCTTAIADAERGLLHNARRV